MRDSLFAKCSNLQRGTTEAGYRWLLEPFYSLANRCRCDKTRCDESREDGQKQQIQTSEHELKLSAELSGVGAESADDFFGCLPILMIPP